MFLQQLALSIGLVETAVLAMKASGATSHKERLQDHAAKYQRRSHKQKAVVRRKYSKAVQGFGTAAVRKYAAHVAAWIAYGPRGGIPDLRELVLLRKFVERLGTGLLPGRLKDVLPDAHAAVQSSRAHQVSEAWHEAESRLQQSLQRFRCCRTHNDKVANRGSHCNDVEVESADTAVAGKRTLCADVVLVSDDELTADSEAEPQDIEETCVDAESSSPPSNQHLKLFRKINEWGLLDESQRLLRLKKAEAATRASHEDLNEAELAEIVQTAVAALSPPRRRASADASASEGLCSIKYLDPKSV